jgi:hypothetical protein
MSDIQLLILSGPFGVVLGVLLGWAITGLQGWLHQRQVRQRVRLLLRLECNQNLTALFEFWGIVSRDGVYLPEKGWLTSVGPQMSEGEYDRRQRLAVWPLRPWGRLMLESQADSLAVALNEDEIKRVYALYSDLEVFTARREELRAQFSTREGELLSDRYSNWMQRNQAPTHDDDAVHLEAALRDFINRTSPLWNDCLATYNRALPYKDSDIGAL